MTDDQEQRTKEIVAKHLNELGEYFDTVRIFVTTGNDNESSRWVSYSEGRGNFYAQKGQIEEWVVREDERIRIDERKDAETEED